MHTALIDSRRLTGPNLYHPRHGAVLEIAVDASDAPEVARRWTLAARAVLDALGWSDEVTVTRSWPGGLGLFVTAPIDALLAATEVTEQALALCESERVAPSDDLIARLRVHVQHERHPRLAALAAAAARRGLGITFDDETVVLGGGTGSRSWPLQVIPHESEIGWGSLHDIPTALITGSNGKTTTTRLIAAMSRRAGRVTGFTCTDGVWIDDAQVEEGDWSGPAGARRVLRATNVQSAVLETARGGILRRGLGVGVAHVAVVTRVTADHFGEYGIHDERSLGEAKLVVRHALQRGGPVVLNADDTLLVTLSRSIDRPIWWFSLDAENPALRQAAPGERAVATVRNGILQLSADDEILLTLPLTEVPITLHGAAQHNVANVLAAALAAHALGIPAPAMAAALRRFGLSPADNPGRLQVRRVNGATVIVDFVHNADGWTAMLDLARRLRAPGGRLILTLGQAGDRDDADLDAMARVVWAARPDLIILKEMAAYLRGRPYGQVTERLGAALREAGATNDILQLAPDEPDASRRALEAARPGDVVLIASHANYTDVIAMVDRAATGTVT